MTQEDVLTRLQALFDNLFLSPVQLTRSLRAADVPEWDSLMHISVVMAAEQEFGVRFRTGEVENTKNVGEFVDLIVTRTTAT